MTKWEYLVTFGPKSIEELDSLGAQGWELVAFERNGDFTEKIVYHFKRPVPDKEPIADDSKPE